MGTFSVLTSTIVFLVIASEWTYINGVCLSPWFPLDTGNETQCFQVVGKKRDWCHARALCSSYAGANEGGDLAIPKNLTALDEYIKDHDFDINITYWIGGSDIANEGVWLWNDAVPITRDTVNWAQDQPNNADDHDGENCLGMWVGDHSRCHDNNEHCLFDRKCSITLDFICEKNP